MDTKTLISLRAWARPTSLLKTLDGLRRCRGVSKYKLLISCDYHSPMMAQQLVEAIELSQIATAIETELVFHDKPVGCTGNFKYVLDKSFLNTEDEWCVFMEDDSYPSIDMLEYFEQTSHLLDDYFAACTMNRPMHELIAPSPSKAHNLVSKNWFEGANAFSMNRARYIKLNPPGVFGIDYQSPRAKEHNCRGEDWLKEVNISDNGAWDQTFEKYFRDLPCLYPVVGRTLNIGKHGYNLSPNQYMKLQYNDNWAHNPMYIERIKEFAWFDLEVRKDEQIYVEDGIYYA